MGFYNISFFKNFICREAVSFYKIGKRNVEVKSILISLKNCVFDEVLIEYEETDSFSFYQDNSYAVVLEGRMDSVDFEGGIDIESYFDKMSLIIDEQGFNFFISCFSGDWSITAINKLTGEIFTARDHHGNTSVFFQDQKDCLVISNYLPFILQNSNTQPLLNTSRLLDVLLANYRRALETVYENIFRLPSGNLVQFKNGEHKISSYWNPRNIKEKKFGNFYSDFLKIFKESIKERGDKKSLAIAMSGGLDSTSVAAMTSKIFQDRKILAFTAIPKYKVDDLYLKNNSVDESFLASVMARNFNNIESIALDSKETSIIKSLYTIIKYTGEPHFAASNYYWLLDILANARKMGCETLFTGQGGNSTISWPPPQYYNGLMKQRGILSYFRKIKRKIKHGSFNLKEYIEENTALNISCFDIQQFEELKKQILHKSKNKSARQTMFDLLKPGNSIIGSFYKQLSIAFGISIYDPTFDKELIEFCASLPQKAFFDKRGSRYLVRKGLKDLLPDKIIENKQKGVQSADIAQRVLEEKKDVFQLLSFFKENRMASSILNIPRMENVLKELEEEISLKGRIKCSRILLRGLMVGIFILEVEKET